MIELFMLVWCAELVLVVATGPAALRYLAARRARRDFPAARITAG